MQLTDFNTQTAALEFQNKSVILLQTKKYSPLLLSYLTNYIAQAQNHQTVKIDFDQDLSIIQRQLETSFLGQTFLYWFPDISSLSSKKKRADIIAYLAAYQGPHCIVGSIGDEIIPTLSNGMIIEVQEHYTSDQVIKLSMLYDKQKPEITAYFIGKLYRYRKQYSAEQLCMLLQYAGVLGKNTEVFFEKWLDQLVVSDISLYWLSQLFFEKKASEFFEVWQQLQMIYSEQFWTSFFSEQLFKAYWFVHWQAKVAPENKAMTFGLPFSFLKHDWKMYQKSTLQKAHQKIYEVDLLLKSGGTSNRLDLFLIQFFQGL